MGKQSAPPNNSAAVLVVEDDAEVRDALCAALELEGYTVYTASNGREGVQKARSLRPDIILMDILMPVMNGIEATAILKNDPLTEIIPILMITVVDKKEDIVKGLESGAIDYIVKPFFMPELKARVNATLRSKRLYDECFQLKEQLTISEERYRQLVDNASEAIIVIQNGIIEFFNPKMLEFMECTADELTSRSFLEMIHPDDRDRGVSLKSPGPPRSTARTP